MRAQMEARAARHEASRQLLPPHRRTYNDGSTCPIFLLLVPAPSSEELSQVHPPKPLKPRTSRHGGQEEFAIHHRCCRSRGRAAAGQRILQRLLPRAACGTDRLLLRLHGPFRRLCFSFGDLLISSSN
jgi:hypothetical protein